MANELVKYKKILEANPEIFKNENAKIEIITNDNVIDSWVVERKKILAEKGLPEEWGEIGVVYEDPYILIMRDLVKFASGQLGTYFRIINSADLRGGQSTVVLPLVDRKILLMRQFRHSTRSWHWEIPRGFGEPNTLPEENARKEVQEEIEGEIAQLINLGLYHSNTGIEGCNVQLFFAQLESVGTTNQDEGIESYKLLEIGKVEEMIRDAEITDGFTIAAFTRAKLRNLI
jgi:ADP-ribose pyrophosphatase